MDFRPLRPSYMDCITYEWHHLGAPAVMHYNHHNPAVVYVPSSTTSDDMKSDQGLVYIINGEEMESFNPVTQVCTPLLTLTRGDDAAIATSRVGHH